MRTKRNNYYYYGPVLKSYIAIDSTDMITILGEDGNLESLINKMKLLGKTSNDYFVTYRFEENKMILI